MPRHHHFLVGGLLAAIAVLPAAMPPVNAQLPQPQEALRVDRFGDPLPPGAIARLGTVRLRAAASALAVSEGGKALLIASGGRSVGRVDAATGRLLGEI